MIKKCAFVVLCGMTLALVTGCGYTNSTLFPQQYHTVAVKLFDNDTFTRDVEFDLDRALVREIEQRTHMKVVKTENADTILSGSLKDFTRRVLSEDSNDEIQELQVVLTVDFEWKDAKTGKIIARRENLSRTGEYVKPLGQTETLAVNDAITDLAQLIVDQMEQPW